MAVIQSTGVCKQEDHHQQMELYDLNPESNNYRIIDYNKRNSPSIYQGMVTQEPNEQVNTIVHEKY